MVVSGHPNGACSTLVAALTLCLLSIGTAQAELFWPHSRSWGWDDYGPFRSHHYRSWGWGDYEPFRQRRQRANKGFELEQKPKSLEVVKGRLRVIISVADEKTHIRRRHIARPFLSINGSAGPPHARRRIQRHWQGSLASLQYLQCSPDALHAADHLVRDRAPCRGFARPSGFSRLHSLGEGLCRSTLASHEAGHSRDHRAQQCRSGPNSEPTPFFQIKTASSSRESRPTPPRGKRSPQSHQLLLRSAKHSVTRSRQPPACHRSGAAKPMVPISVLSAAN